MGQPKTKQLEGRGTRKTAQHGKSNNDAPDFSDIDTLVKMESKNNVDQPLLEIDFDFVKYMPHEANIWGIKFDTAKQVWKHRIVS